MCMCAGACVLAYLLASPFACTLHACMYVEMNVQYARMHAFIYAAMYVCMYVRLFACFIILFVYWRAGVYVCMFVCLPV